MFKYTLDEKPIFTKYNGDEIKDLTESIFNFNNALTSNVNVFRLTKTYCMRPDLVANAAFDNTDNMELILKVNGISNPFTINEDDILIIPTQDQLASIVKPAVSNYSGDNTLRQAYKYIDPAKYPSKSEEVENFDKRNFSNNTQILPPNISQKDENQYEIRNGRVYFGENIGKSCLKNGMSITDYMKTIIKSK